MPPPLTICIVSHLYPVSPDDYKGVFVHRIAEQLAARGHTVHVVTPLRPGGARTESRDGVIIHRYWWWGWRRGRQLSQLEGTPPLTLSTLLAVGIVACLTVVLRHRLRLIYAYWVVPGGFIAWVCGRLTGRRVVVTAAGTDLNVSAQRPLTRPFVTRTLRGTDRLIACGSEMERLARQMGTPAERCVVMPSLVLEGETNGEPAQALPGAAGARLLYVGNLDPPKRIDTLLRAMARVARERPDACLTLVGDGGLREDLEALAERLVLGRRVRFLGRRPHEQIPSLMRGSDLFLHCSDAEGLPVAIHEALAAGLPVIAARVGGIPDLVRDGENGRLLAPDDHAGFARAIVELAGDPDRRRAMADAALRFARERLRHEDIVDQIEAIFRSLTPDQPPPAAPGASRIGRS